jgi:hypothetical protein
MIFDAKKYKEGSFKTAIKVETVDTEHCFACGNKLSHKIFTTKDGKKFCSKSCKEDEGN